MVEDRAQDVGRTEHRVTAGWKGSEERGCLRGGHGACRSSEVQEPEHSRK